jgi:diguanylate cyclase (GGDEF)-like protein
VVAALLALVLTTTIVLTINNNNKLGEILEESVESELLATCTAARNEVDVDLLMSINSEADFNANRTQIDRVLKRLRDLKNEVEATYIYALKEINGKYYFIFDTDEEAGTPDNPIFDEYELSPVHEAAFAGRRVADHVEDEWGSYNTGAIPIYRDGKVVGIICADFEDFYIERSQQAAALDTALLIAVMVSTMIILLGLLVTLLRRNQKMQENLFYVANHDAITGLYNRYYLFTYLAGWNKSRYSLNSAFTLLFIDLDNFKRVNDNAGHDEGDKLLRLISDFFKEYSNADASSSKIESLTARIGGDEFVQVIADIGTPKGAEQRARAMLRDFAARPELQEYIRDYDIGLSIGGALFPSQSGDYSELLRFADIAMYQAKYNGKNNYCLYNESLGDGPEGVVLSIRKSSRSNTKDA